ncbi:hypothetical protein FA95DRAFT_1542135 [Auriscalpium vulgare]|uniref:Uncharacterized protein n=1 Tax=Auriscalpium vulgare TaxID=40419 RepID=A0ACB8RSY1_9AGAM|nr:hypothetical protein FA95DRAFT_1542135 [Auriscalpium vulgare]
MTYFRPVRSSPPPISSSATTLVPTALSDVSGVSRSSLASSPELASLTPDEVDFIDAVIARASPSETTFLNVFKAYNAVLQERGLDPGSEVVYYGKLLKLGTLKGANWGDKWRAVKAQNGYAGPSSVGLKKLTSIPPPPPPATSTPKASAARLLARLRALNHRRPDSAESVADDVTEAATEDTELDFPQTRRRPTSPSQLTSTTNSLGLDIDGDAGSYPTPKSASRPIPARHPQTRRLEAAQSAPSLSSMSRPAPRNGVPAPQPIFPRTRRPSISSASPPKTIARPPERKSVVNEDDAWNKIRMAQDEKDADRFRNERLLERCLDVWKQGIDWVTTTSEQIDHARHTLILRRSVQTWRLRLQERRALEQRVDGFASKMRTKHAFAAWRDALQAKRAADWRRDMRAKMKIVRETREAKLRKDAWARWRQLYQSRLSRQHYAQRLVLRFVTRWREKLAGLDGLEEAADGFVVRREKRVLMSSLDAWRTAGEMRGLEAALAAKVAMRTVREAFAVWRSQTHDLQAADTAHDALLLKFTVQKWKGALTRIRAMERRADKHVARQDDILVMAVSRVWRAHERGRLLERVRDVRVLRQTMDAWKKRKRQQEELEAQAQNFYLRSGTHVVSSAVAAWRERRVHVEQATALAVEYSNLQLQYRMLRAWRLLLRAKIDMQRQAGKRAKVQTKKVWMRRWVAKLQERRREKMLQEMERRKLTQLFIAWKDKALRQRRLRLAEQEVEVRVVTRVLRDSMTHWTNRVIDLKVREIEVAKRSDRILQLAVFDKWKALLVRHAEELSLMESHKHIKRDELIRRTFHKWLVAARGARNRRMILQEREDEMKRFVLAAAWDKWRGRFQTEKLLPLERMFGLQNQNALMYRSFLTWHSRTKSLPAIQFHTAQTKMRFWKIWRDAMPNALMAKKAREADSKAVLSKAFEKWLQAHRTKIALRAVARARYMRLPTTSSTRPAVAVRQPQPQASTSRIPPARKLARPAPLETDTEHDTDTPAPPLAQPKPRRPPSRSVITGFPSSRTPVSRALGDTSPTRPRFSTRSTAGTREPSPTRSRVSRDTSPARSAVSRPPSTAAASRGSLWLELREIQRKSRTPTVRSARSPEPP